MDDVVVSMRTRTHEDHAGLMLQCHSDDLSYMGNVLLFKPT